MSLFIVFEGIEGSGKSTQIELLGAYLHKHNIPCIITREPGGTPVGEEVRKIFLHAENRAITPLTELLLVTAARVQHVETVIRPALQENRVVLCDRYFDATAAYQGYAGGIDLSLIESSHQLFLDSFMPDLTVLFDCPVEVGLARSRDRNRAEGIETDEGRFEDKDTAFHEKVRQGYLQRADREPHRFRIVDARQSAEAVRKEVADMMGAFFREQGYAV